MNQINAISNKMIQEAIRLKTPIVSLLFVVALLVYFPFALHGDGTVLGTMQLILHYSLMLVFTLLALQSIYLATLSFDRELKQKQFFLIDIKPIPRWKFFVGKLMGISILNFFLLVILGTITWSNIYIFSNYQITEKEKQVFQERIYTSARGSLPYFDYAALEKDVETRYKKSVDEGHIPPDANTIKLKEELRNKLRESNQYVPHQYTKLFVFLDIDPSIRKLENAQIRLRYKIYTTNASYASKAKTRWIIGRYTRYEYKDESKIGEFLEFAFPANAVEADGRLEIYFNNIDPDTGTVYFPKEDGMEVLYPQGSFAVNLGKFLVLIWFVLILLSSISLFCSTFLSFSVAMLTSLFTLFLGIIIDFFREMIIGVQESVEEQGSVLYDVLLFVYTKIFDIIYFIVPNFSEYLAFESIANGRYIELTTILQCFFFIILIDSAFLVLLGCYIFRQREVAKPIM